MKKYKNDYIWNDRMCHHLPYEMMVDVIDLYRDCFDYSAYREYDQIMAFVTRCFIDRNKQLEIQRTIAQVKMKFNFLTIYYDGGQDPYLDEIVNTAAKMAKQIQAKINKQYGKGGPWNRKILHSVKDR